MRLTVLGLGYLGATHAACMAELGHEVLGVEVDRDRLTKLTKGELPFYEPGLAELLGKHIDSGDCRSRIPTNMPPIGATSFSSLSGHHRRWAKNSADLSQVEAVVDSLVPWLKHDAVIFGKSTVPVGTAQALASRAADLAKGVLVEIAWNPEFLREGHAIADTLHPIAWCWDGPLRAPPRR